MGLFKRTKELDLAECVRVYYIPDNTVRSWFNHPAITEVWQGKTVADYRKEVAKAYPSMSPHATVRLSGVYCTIKEDDVLKRGERLYFDNPPPPKDLLADSKPLVRLSEVKRPPRYMMRTERRWA